MSRKSRNRTKIVRDDQRSAATHPLDFERGTTHRLTGELGDMFEAVVTGCAILAFEPIASPLDAELEEFMEELDDLFDADRSDIEPALDVDEADDPDPDDEPFEDDEMATAFTTLDVAYGGLALTTRILARGLLARVLRRDIYLMPDADPVPDVRAGTEAAALAALAHTLLPANLPADIRPSRADRRDAIGNAALLIAETGLEEFDVAAALARGPDGLGELITYPVSPEMAHVALMEFLFNRTEATALTDDLFVPLERDASAWHFSRWSVDAPPGRVPPELASFARHVREREYSLVDHPMTALGASMIDTLATDDGFAELFPRQSRMADSLLASFTDVFECVAVDGSRVRLRSVPRGSTYEVHEHMDPAQYSTGWLAFGRLLPFEGTLHLRSPGMVFVPPNDAGLGTRAVAALDRLSASLPPALALEATISSVVFGERVPLDTKPARSRADARALLEMLQVLVEGVELDSLLESFMAALRTQAESGSASRSKRVDAGSTQLSSRRIARRRKG